VMVILDLAHTYIGCEPCKQDWWENSYVFCMYGPSLAYINVVLKIYFFSNSLFGLFSRMDKKL
jgi:hypothetical protein